MWTRSRTAVVAMLAIAGTLAGCASVRAQDRSSHGAPATSPAVVSDATNAPAASSQDPGNDPVAALIDATPPERIPVNATHARTPAPPRANGKTFNTAIVDQHGQTRCVEIRLRDNVAETRVDGQLVPADRVLVHRRGFVEVVDAQGVRELSFNLPRGGNAVTRDSR
jgi:uncharacterized protein YceK